MAGRQWWQGEADQNKKGVKQSESSICHPLTDSCCLHTETDYEGQVINRGGNLDGDVGWTGMERQVWERQEGISVPNTDWSHGRSGKIQSSVAVYLNMFYGFKQHYKTSLLFLEASVALSTQQFHSQSFSITLSHHCGRLAAVWEYVWVNVQETLVWMLLKVIFKVYITKSLRNALLKLWQNIWKQFIPHILRANGKHGCWKGKDGIVHLIWWNSPELCIITMQEESPQWKPGFPSIFCLLIPYPIFPERNRAVH